MELLAQGTSVMVKVGLVYLELAAKSFTGPGGSAAIIDTTTLKSVAKEKRMGLRDEGQLGLTLNFDPANAAQTALQTHRADKSKADLKITFEDGTTMAFFGYVSTFSIAGSVDGIVEASVSIEITGAVTLTVAP